MPGHAAVHRSASPVTWRGALPMRQVPTRDSRLFRQRNSTGLSIEISVLGPLEPIDPRIPDAIVIGRHGLVVEQGRHRGLLLPQVATEWGWTTDQFLAPDVRQGGPVA